jgi:surface antigen
VKLFRKTVALALGTVAAGAFAVATSTPAAAQATCPSGDFCYYYDSSAYGYGSMAAVPATVYDLGNNGSGVCYKFTTTGAGQGQCVKNNAAAVANATGHTETVFYNSDYGGNSQTVLNGWTVNLNGWVKNNNASNRPAVSSGNDYSYRNQVPPAGTYVADQWNFFKGECTSFAAWTVVTRRGRTDFQNSYHGVTFGNAGNWASAAASIGLPVSSTPAVGDIAVLTYPYGNHVAYVTGVNSNGTFNVDEYNWTYGHGFDQRTASVGTGSTQFNKFIKF